MRAAAHLKFLPASRRPREPKRHSFIGLMSSFCGRTSTMGWKLSPRGHDPRQIDLLAVVALLVTIVAIGHYLIRTEHPTPRITNFIEPSQTVRW
jgi:hypothetical protein